MRKIFLAGWFLAAFVPSVFAEGTAVVIPGSDKSHSPLENSKVNGTSPGNLLGEENRSQDKPAAKIFLGEKMRFEVAYLGITVGDAEAEVKELVKVNGRDTYHVEINVRSRPVLDWIYKVRDTHHSYIDAERFDSLRYEKKIQEGKYWTSESMEYDQENHIGYFFSLKDNSRKEMFIPKNVQDQISCCYWLRLQEVKPDTKILIPVNADEKNWDLEVVTHGVKEMKLKGVGGFQAVEVEPIILFEGFFVRRGKIRGWMSLDERHIPLVMKVKVPVLGDVSATLVHYEPGSGAQQEAH